MTVAEGVSGIIYAIVYPFGISNTYRPPGYIAIALGFTIGPALSGPLTQGIVIVVELNVYHTKVVDMDDFKPGKPECLDMVEVDFDYPSQKKGPRKGRERGATNLKTRQEKLFKKQMEEHFQKVIRKEFKYILASTIDKAKDGDMTATRIIFDRVIPVGKAVDLNDNKGAPTISINIGSLDDKTIVSDQ